MVKPLSRLIRSVPLPKPVLLTSSFAALGIGLVAGYLIQPEQQSGQAGIVPTKQALEASALSKNSAQAKSSQAQNGSQALNVSAQQPVQTDLMGALMDQGQRRTYYLHTPPSYQDGQSMPLVLAFHESEGQGKDMAAHTGLNKLADKEGFMVVYPDGINAKWNVSGQAETKEDNVAFVQALLAHLGQIRAIDHQRVYATGLSNGGILVQKLACQNPGQIAAFATVAASLPSQFETKCQNQTPVSILMINGTADEVVPWQGGEPPDVKVGRDLSLPPIPDVFKFWQTHDRCPAPATVEQRADKRVTSSSATQCQAGTEVTLLALNGASHIWPGGGYGESQFLDASQTIWAFFQRHPLGATSSQSVTTGQTTSAH